MGAAVSREREGYDGSKAGTERRSGLEGNHRLDLDRDLER